MSRKATEGLHNVRLGCVYIYKICITTLHPYDELVTALPTLPPSVNWLVTG